MFSLSNRGYKIEIVNDWKGGLHYGGSIILIGWLDLDAYKSYSFIVLGIGFSITKGSLDV